jgi:hypothetical protein
MSDLAGEVMAVGWRPRLGAYLHRDAVTFRVWAPMRRHVELLLRPGLPASERRSLTRADDGTFTG